MSRFRIDKIDSVVAGSLVENSPYLSVFVVPEVLENLSPRVDWWLVSKGDEPLCVWPVTLNSEGRVQLPGFTYYVGPLWLKSMDDLPGHRSLSETSGAYELFIRTFIENYREVRASLPLGLLDVRAFDWWNYHEPTLKRFVIRPRYTALIDRLDQQTEQEIISGFRELRRRELRRVEKFLGGLLADRAGAEELVALYGKTLERQGKSFQETTKKQIGRLAELVDTPHAEVFSFRSKETGECVSAVLLLYDPFSAHMVLNLLHEDSRKTGLGPWTVTQSILGAKSRGCLRYDFNGANSPNRGDDKHSYGSRPSLHFQVEYSEKSE
ncbi:MAG: GNAT family N-acetyltransferase [Bradymonadales bacterium]|nr:MAG: GNAT family N-acetyltransferase [Bradymonadales bacterium]